MKTALFTVLKRNGVVTVLLIALITGLRLVSPQFYWPAVIIVLFGGLVGFIWACRSLADRIGRIATGVLTAFVVVIVGFFSLVASVLTARAVVEYRYRDAGYEMRTGCNLGAAMHAETSLFTLSNRIDELREDSPTDTNELRRLQDEYAATKKRLEFLEADLRRRGHRGTVPVPKDAKSLQPTAAAPDESHHD
jgi:hypothetical protein